MLNHFIINLDGDIIILNTYLSNKMRIWKQRQTKMSSSNNFYIKF